MIIPKLLAEEIVELLFQNELPGSSKIGLELLRTGYCVVAGTSKPWIGGVGNFVSLSEAENAVGCSVIKLDPKFFQSSLFKEALLTVKTRRAVEIKNITTRLEELRQIDEAVDEMLDER